MSDSSLASDEVAVKGVGFSRTALKVCIKSIPVSQISRQIYWLHIMDTLDYIDSSVEYRVDLCPGSNRYPNPPSKTTFCWWCLSIYRSDMLVCQCGLTLAILPRHICRSNNGQVWLWLFRLWYHNFSWSWPHRWRIYDFNLHHDLFRKTRFSFLLSHSRATRS